jgi:ABC-type dipeptide/oligopeptide/nickel transport system permease subunit
MIPETTVIDHSGISAMQPKISETRRVFRVMFSRWVVIFGAVIIVIAVIAAVFAPFIAPYKPNKQNLQEVTQQPSNTHLLGTDWLGRDVMSRLIYGTQISLVVGALVVSVGAIIGMILGLAAGYFGGWTNNIIMRVMDTMLSLPPLVMALTISAILGSGLRNIIIALGVSMVPGYCRLMCGQVLSIKQSDYITAMRSIGASSRRIMLRHLFPNAFPPLLVLFTLHIGTTILAEAGLSYLGFGILPPTATWGNMVSGGYKYLLTNPILSFAPGIAIILLVLSFNMVGDGLRDALDPRLRGTL